MKTTRLPAPPGCRAVAACSQRGLGLAGFLAAAIPVIWLGLAGVELAYWLQLRQVISLILMDTARAGATRQAEPGAMARTFEQGLHRIYPAPGEVHAVLARRRRDLGTPWHIAVQLPGRQAFSDHADPTLRGPAGSGQPMIRNDHQTAQHAARQAQGWPLGRGPRSGLTIYEANTLRLALQWPHKALFPGAAALVRTLAPLAGDARNRHWMAAGYLPFRRTVAVAMHSHPGAWPDLPDGRITHEGQPLKISAPGPDAGIPAYTAPAPPPQTGTGTKGDSADSADPTSNGPDGEGADPPTHESPTQEHPRPEADPPGRSAANEELCAP